MKFGLFFQTPEAPGQSHGERFAEMLDRIALADSLGFDVAWLAELHFGGAFSLLSSPLMAVPVIAQRTRRIRPSAPPSTRRKASPTSATSDSPSTRVPRPRPCPSFAST